jgi:DNA gyrase subunit B
MNPEQLWANARPGGRAASPVRIEHADETDEIFSTLMGDIVEPAAPSSG